MKKLSIVIALLLTVSAQAQFLIPKVGMTISTTNAETFDDGSYFDTFNSATRFSAGLGYRFEFGKLFSIQPELLFIQKGWENEHGYYGDPEDWYTYTQTFKLNYLELPVLLQVALGPDNFKFHINAGPSIGFGLNGKHENNLKQMYAGTFYDDTYDGDIKFEERPEAYEGPDEFIPNRIEVGAQFGGGVTFFNKIIVDVRYGLGLTDLYDDRDSKNRVLQFSIGVPIRIGL